MAKRPQDKFVDKAPHLIEQKGSPEVWRRGGDQSVQEVLQYDKNTIRRTVDPKELKKGE
jgi:hypothetical protein